MVIPALAAEYLAIASGVGISLFAFKHFEEAGRFSFAGISIILMSMAMASGHQTSVLAIGSGSALAAMLSLIIASTIRHILPRRERAK